MDAFTKEITQISDIVIYNVENFNNENKISLKVCDIEIIMKTDFTNYCFITFTNCDIMNEFNIDICYTDISIDNIVLNLKKIASKLKYIDDMDDDVFNLTNNKENVNNIKKLIHYNKLDIDLSVFQATKKFTIVKDYEQRKLIIEDIKKINNNTDNYIMFENVKNLYDLTIKLIFDKDSDMGKIMNIIKEKYNYEYIEFHIILSEDYPHVPPMIEYYKPNIEKNLLLGILDTDILKLCNWNNNISLYYIVSKLCSELEKKSRPYINIHSDYNNNVISFNLLEYYLYKLMDNTEIYNKDNNIKIGEIINRRNIDNTITERYDYHNEISSDDNYYKYINYKYNERVKILEKILYLLNIDITVKPPDYFYIFFSEFMKNSTFFEIGKQEILFLKLFEIFIIIRLEKDCPLTISLTQFLKYLKIDTNYNNYNNDYINHKIYDMLIIIKKKIDKL